MKKRLDVKPNKIIYPLSVAVIALFLFVAVALKALQVNNFMAWDELGYWSNAAYLVGYDWSSVCSAFSGYYSYGYSLIIAVLFALFKEGPLAYQMAIVLNAVFLSLTFLLLIYSGNLITCNKRKWDVLCCATIASFYSNNL